jgi:hypothetical protein
MGNPFELHIAREGATSIGHRLHRLIHGFQVFAGSGEVLAVLQASSFCYSFCSHSAAENVMDPLPRRQMTLS